MISWARCVLGQTQDPAESPGQADDPSKSPMAVLSSSRPASSAASATPILIAALIVAIVASLGLVHQQRRRAQALERQLAMTHQDNERLLVQNQQLTRELSDLQAERSTLDEHVQLLGAQLSSINVEFQQANERLAKSQALSDNLQEMHQRLQAQIVSANLQRDAAQRQAEQLKDEKAELGRSVLRLRNQLAFLERDYRDVANRLVAVQTTPHPDVSAVTTSGPSLARGSTGEGGNTSTTATGAIVELPPVVVPTTRSEVSMPLHGRLVDVNERYRFIVINKGQRDGVREGMVFDVRHGQTDVAHATVIRVRPQLAACNVTYTAGSGSLTIGDSVVQQTP